MKPKQEKEKIPTEEIDKIAVRLSKINDVFEGEFLATIIAKDGQIEIKEVVSYDVKGDYEK